MPTHSAEWRKPGLPVVLHRQASREAIALLCTPRLRTVPTPLEGDLRQVFLVDLGRRHQGDASTFFIEVAMISAASNSRNGLSSVAELLLQQSAPSKSLTGKRAFFYL